MGYMKSIAVLFSNSTPHHLSSAEMLSHMQSVAADLLVSDGTLLDTTPGEVPVTKRRRVINVIRASFFYISKFLIHSVRAMVMTIN